MTTDKQQLNDELTHAVLLGDAAAARSLLAAGADANHHDGRMRNYPGPAGDFPVLLLAVLRDDAATARILLEAGADANARCMPYITRLSGLAMAFGMQSFGKCYRSYGSNYHGPALFHARSLEMASSAAMASLLLEHGASLNLELNRVIREERANCELLEVLLRANAGKALSYELARHLPLHKTASEGQAGLLELMLQAGAHADWQDARGRAPLHLASAPEVVRVLLAHGATLNAPDEDCVTPLGSAVERGDAAVATELRAQGARRLHVRPVPLPLLHECVLRGDMQRVKAALTRGADVNARNEYGATPLFFARTEGMTRLLLQHGANANARDEFNSSALSFARNRRQHALLLAATGLPTDTPLAPLPPMLPRYDVWSKGTRPIPCGAILGK